MKLSEANNLKIKQSGLAVLLLFISFWQLLTDTSSDGLGDPVSNL